METVKSMTSVSLSQADMRQRLLSDKTALEARLHEIFDLRKSCVFPHKDAETVAKFQELVKTISAELRSVKRKLSELVVQTKEVT